MSASLHATTQHYGVAHWGEGYFGINAKGHASVCPRLRAGEEIDLYELALDVRAAGMNWPILLRFDDLLADRTQRLCQAFSDVAAELDYSGGYRAVYPIKVNQQRSVVERIAAVGCDCVGLEAGSKPELMAVLAAAAAGAMIVCNGYKDREYIRLALIGQQLGHQVFIVIEKPSELGLVLQESAELGIEPLLGVRVRLAAVAGGKWQNSGGANAKFGLSAAQLLELIEQLKAADLLHTLGLLHSHIGSQIPDIADIGHGLAEAGRYFVALRQAGAPLRVLDVGGGLGVDYEGSASRHYCSRNYSMQAYAREVLSTIQQVCQQYQLPEPMIFSESGRALTAHHAILVTEVLERESPSIGLTLPNCLDDFPLLAAMMALRDSQSTASPLLIWQEAQHLFDLVRQGFERGDLDLPQRAQAEQLLYVIADEVRAKLRPESRRHRDLLDQLNGMLAERMFCNFSLFQSLPDVWALDQVFPVMPLQRLDESPNVAAKIHDLTCDSDGCISQYVDQDGVEPTLAVHADDGYPYLLAVFLVGAYQEILGDMHNLFGDTDAVNVQLDGQGGYRLDHPERGDSVDELLRYVHFEPQQMLEQYRRKLVQHGAPPAAREAWFRELKAGLHGTTYLVSDEKLRLP